MNVLLVRPPTVMGAEHAHAQQHPVNLCWLAAYLKAQGMRTKILDYEAVRYSDRHFRNMLLDYRPRVVGYTAMTPGIEIVGGMARIAAETRARVVNVVGGPHVSILPVQTLNEFPHVHAVVGGEGEKAFFEICRDVRRYEFGDRAIPSVIIRRGDGLVGDTTARMPPLDLDTLPMPDRGLLDLKKYAGAPTPGIPLGGDRATQLFTARGCPGRCIFCCSDHIFGRKVRTRSVEHVMEEVHECMNRYGIRHFTIDNDTFTHDREFVMKFCGEMERVDATWDCDTRVDRVDGEMLEAMAGSGCLKVAYGVETGSEEILKAIRKGITLDQVREAFNLTRRTGMLSCAFLMLGNHPDETGEDILKTIRLVSEIKPDLISVALATPYPGTGLREAMREEGLLEDRPWSDYDQSFQGAPFVKTKTLSTEKLGRLQTKMLRNFYLRPGYIARRLAMVRSPRELLYWAGAGVGFIEYLFKRKTRQ